MQNIQKMHIFEIKHESGNFRPKIEKLNE